MRTRVGAMLLVALVAACAVATRDAVAAPQAPRIERTATIWDHVESRCATEASEPLAPYPWPIAPVHVQHPVRGYFGDPRTVVTGIGEGAYSFHNGVDISAWTGNHVLPVVSGVVVRVVPNEVVVASSYDRRFQYIHIIPRVRVGEQVVASQTVLGTIAPVWHHVHLSEIRGICVVNPLMPGHLTPFHDGTHPVVEAVSFQQPSGRPMSRLALRGEVRVIADAYDRPAIPSPPPWGSMPVSPVEIAWKLETLTHHVLTDALAVDFRYSLPPRRDFCDVYAPGTVQNFAAVEGRFRWGKPGRYLYDLTPGLLDTTQLRPGYYEFVVTASNVGGNTGARTVVVRVRPPLRDEDAATAPVDLRCSR